MKKGYITFTILSLALTLCSCLKSENKNSEQIAKTYCGSCHLFPDPSLLDKNTWRYSVMPQMAFRMGLDKMEFNNVPKPELKIVKSIIPSTAIINENDWKLITEYYQTFAPDTLPQKKLNFGRLTQFSPKALKKNGEGVSSVITVQTDLNNKSIWVSDLSSNLYKLNHDFTLEKASTTNNPISHIIFQAKEEPIMLKIGNMKPNDLPIGSLEQIDSKKDNKVLIDSLVRPVYAEKHDLDNDQIDDFIICSYGNYSGALLYYKGLENGQFRKYTLSNSSGARKFIVKDFNNDGLSDIIAMFAQGDERIEVFINKGSLSFEAKTLLRFPPVYGSSYFDLLDFNNDGRLDIIYTNGDNLDFSKVIKPYHGVRIFLGKENFTFEESMFFAFPGAYQTEVEDFDQDGDLDIFLISFFPDFHKNQPGFIYMENKDGRLKFEAKTMREASDARWLRCDKSDFDGDGDLDLILGSMNLGSGVPSSIARKWANKNISLLVLFNQKNIQK